MVNTSNKEAADQFYGGWPPGKFRRYRFLREDVASHGSSLAALSIIQKIFGKATTILHVHRYEIFLAARVLTNHHEKKPGKL